MGQAKKKQMECPVVGRRIKPAECGENRITRYDCPESCPHNPWSAANYERALEINDRFSEKMLHRLKAEQMRRGFSSPPPFDTMSNEFELLSWFSNKYYREKGADGLTLKERWEKEGYRGLNNDLRLLIEQESGMYPCLLEILQVEDDRSMLVQDLLCPERGQFRLVDKSLAERACRFSTLFCVLYDMPYFSRLHTAGFPMPDVSGMAMRDVFDEEVRHLGAPEDEALRAEWLMEHVADVANGLGDVAMARVEIMMRSMDVKFTKSFYQLTGTEEQCTELLDQQPDMDADELTDEEIDAGFLDGWACFSENNPVGAGEMLLGRVLLHKDRRLMVEASSGERSAELKAKVEALLAGMVSFESESEQDLAAQVLEEQGASYNAALVPDSLLKHAGEVGCFSSRVKIPEEVTSQAEMDLHLARQFMETFCDEEIPMLGGLTPRQVAGVPEHRPALIELMKYHVRKTDELNLRLGTREDINGTLEELGLRELIFDLPPDRAPYPPKDEWEDDWSEEEWEDNLPVMFMSEDIERRSMELAGYDSGYLVECFKKEFSDVAACLGEVINVLAIQHLSADLHALAARICYQYKDPEAGALILVPNELLLNNVDFLHGEFVENGPDGLLDALWEPAVSGLVVERLGSLLPGAPANAEAFVECLILLLAISESLRIIAYKE